MNNQPFYQLTPDQVMISLESLGWPCDGRQLALNSYENRVYQVWLEDQPPIVAKFYRPQRWTDEQILEEHGFTAQLAEAEIPVIAPLLDEQGKSLHHSDGFRIAVYPCRGGRAPELDNEDHLRWIGRFIGRIHAMGKMDTFQYRNKLSIDAMGWGAREYLLSNDWIPNYLTESYTALSENVLNLVQQRFDAVGPLRQFRIHGDCHPGNILWTDAGPHFVDFDDAINGPAIQDLWMLMSGDEQDMQRQLDVILEGYGDFADFDPTELVLIEPLRTLRMMNYSAWLARRWSDPAFPHNFPWFEGPRFWEEHINDLHAQLSAMQQNEYHY